MSTKTENSTIRIEPVKNGFILSQYVPLGVKNKSTAVVQGEKDQLVDYLKSYINELLTDGFIEASIHIAIRTDKQADNEPESVRLSDDTVGAGIEADARPEVEIIRPYAF
jgi:hypothetical protein